MSIQEEKKVKGVCGSTYRILTQGSKQDLKKKKKKKQVCAGLMVGKKKKERELGGMEEEIK